MDVSESVARRADNQFLPRPTTSSRAIHEPNFGRLDRVPRDPNAIKKERNQREQGKKAGLAHDLFFLRARRGHDEGIGDLGCPNARRPLS